MANEDVNKDKFFANADEIQILHNGEYKTLEEIEKQEKEENARKEKA